MIDLVETPTGPLRFLYRELMDLRAMLKVMRAGHARTRLAAVRDGRSAVRLSMTAAALDSGLLDALADGPLTTGELAGRLDVVDQELFGAFVAALEAGGLVDTVDGRHQLTGRARKVHDDEVARATYSAFSDYHTGLYRDLITQLRGGSGRVDVTESAETIARLSEVMAPFVEAMLRKEVRAREARRLLDVGCGSGHYLATMLEASSGAEGVGVEIDPSAAELARERLHRLGLSGRATVVTGDASTALTEAPGPYEVVLLANVIYYLPKEERTELLRTVRDALSPTGVLILVTPAAIDDSFSRHFDLLLRALDGDMQLPDMTELATQMEAAGLTPGEPRRIAPGEPLMALIASPGPA